MIINVAYEWGRYGKDVRFQPFNNNIILLVSVRPSAFILSKAAAYFCVIADNDFLNDPHNLIYSRILLIMIALNVPIP